MGTKKLLEYNNELLTYEQLVKIANKPCSASGMRIRIKRTGCVYKAVEETVARRTRPYRKLQYYDKELTYKELGEIANPPCAASTMKKRIKRTGCVYKAVEEKVVRRTRTGRKLLYYDQELTYKELGMLASPPCSGDSMRRRIKKLGCVYAAVSAKSRIYKLKYYDEYLTIKQMCERAKHKCSHSAMSGRLKRLGCVYKAVDGCFYRPKKIEYNGEYFTYEELAKRAVHPCTASGMQQRIRRLGSVSAAIEFTKVRRKASLFDKFPNPELARCLKKRLLSSTRRKEITIDDLYEIGESQNWRCALSGIEMTFRNGGDPANVSIDRIKAGGSYTPDNVRLVCSAVNKFRNNLSTEDFIYYCTCVANHNKKELKIASQAS